MAQMEDVIASIQVLTEQNKVLTEQSKALQVRLDQAEQEVLRQRTVGTSCCSIEPVATNSTSDGENV